LVLTVTLQSQQKRKKYGSKMQTVGKQWLFIKLLREASGGNWAAALVNALT